MKVDRGKRAHIFADYILKNKSTVREVAQIFGVSKSTVHSDVSYFLAEIDFGLFLKVKGVLFNNFKNKHLNGGLVTAKKHANKVV